MRTLLVWAAFLALHLQARAVLRGLTPEAEELYQAGKPFHCTDGKALPYENVNDEFCDCADGSDEPGTGACAGQDKTLFHCKNIGSTPQLVYSSRVDDGICDCCDGSDEAGLAARHPDSACMDRCAEEGVVHRQQRAERLEQLKVGLTKKEDIVQTAQKDREGWLAEIERLRNELPALEAQLAEAKKLEEESKKEETPSDADLKTEVESLKKTVQEQQALIDELKRDLAVLKGADAGGDSGAKAATADGAAAEPVVSEYAKWMDGADSTPGAIKKEDEADAVDTNAIAKDVQDDLDSEDHDGAEGEGDDEEEELGPTKPVGKPGSPADEAQKAVNKNKADVKKLEKKFEHITEENLGFSALHDHCLSKNDGQYTYNICFFNDAKQDSVLLGHFSGWTGPAEAHFTDGQMCPGGPARELRVFFECGSEEEVHEVTEPSRCSYEAHISHPGACDAAHAAALESPPVRHPKDEL